MRGGYRVNFVFAAAAALLLDGFAVVLLCLAGYHYGKREQLHRQKTVFAAINTALTELNAMEIAVALKSCPDKIVGLLRAASHKREQVTLNQHAREAEFKT
jgi:hypothetical protein